MNDHFAVPNIPELAALFSESRESRFRAASDRAALAATQTAESAEMMLRAARAQAETISSSHRARIEATLTRAAEAAPAPDPMALATGFFAHCRDAGERMILTLDALRERGDVFIAHEEAGCPPVLDYDYELLIDGKDLERPCNYQLLRIIPPEGVNEKLDKRPYIIIDPRAGHGGGIGGFKRESQVGVALMGGHPVYFVAFHRNPAPGQTIADVTRAEAIFAREVMRRHPESAAPCIVGNCQGGWATLILAATNPDVTGPIVLNGAPVAPWSGKVGTNPMRYNGGVLGGTWIPMLRADLGGGVFDGADLVQNFEALNPSRNFFRKYFDLYQDPEGVRARFLGFERWWGGFFLFNEAEIRWIVETMFVGNRISRNCAQLEPGVPIDVKAVQGPIIVFASHGDNITPPQQALNWILDAYGDEEEIRIRGQRIIYMLHEDVGHLGIFVSSKIAQKEHAEMASTMKTIEALAPGLYEMKVDDTVGRGLDKKFLVSFEKRSLADIAAVDDGREDEAAFAAVARASEIQAELYDVLVRPWLKALITPQIAEASRQMHPMRVQRGGLSSRNPFLWWLPAAADTVRKRREAEGPASDGENPWTAAENLWADGLEQSMDLVRDMRDAWTEWKFFSLWGGPWARAFGADHMPRRPLMKHEALEALPSVQAALMQAERGGMVEAVIRMMILMADSRGQVRRDRLERSARILTKDAPFNERDMQERARIIHEQTLIATFAPERAAEALPLLLPDAEDREKAAAAVQFVAGPLTEMAPHTRATLDRLRGLLDLPPAVEEVTADPFAA